MEKRFSSLSDPRWADAISTLIYHSKDRYFRWHDSGDLKDLEHLRNIVRVCLNLPRVKFWLPTREYQTVETYRRMGGQIPPNLCIRYSAHLVDGPPPLHYGLPTSTVFSAEAPIASKGHACPAPTQNMKCGNCRACWDPAVKLVSYHLRWASSEFSRGGTCPMGVSRRAAPRKLLTWARSLHKDLKASVSPVPNCSLQILHPLFSAAFSALPAASGHISPTT